MTKAAVAVVLVAVALLATAQAPPPPPAPPVPAAWEYKVLPNFDARALEEHLNKYAAAGWEVSHTVGGSTLGNVILRRPRR